VIALAPPVDIYVRVSRVGGRENLISPEDQEGRARDLARDRGLRVGRVIQDIDESGGKWDRPGLQEVLERVERGRSGGVIVAWLDRLSRDSEHALALVRRISDAGGVIYAPDAPPDMLSPEGELQSGILFAFAMYQRKRARVGFERAKERAIANGIPVKTRPPVGYRRRSDRRLEPDPVIAPVVREVFERRALGDGPAALASFLEERGVRTSQGSRTWSKQAIYGLLKNRAYLGELVYGRDRRYLNVGAFDAIVDEALWLAAQNGGRAKLAPARSYNSMFLLTGIARCASCRYSLQATTTSRGKRIYRCTRRHAGGICAAPVRVQAEPVEDVVIAAFWALTDDLDAEGREDVEGDLAALERDHARADDALKQWLSIDVQNAIGDTAEYADGLKERRVARDELLERVRHARSARGRVLPDAQTLRAAWERMSAQERRELLALRFDCLALRPDRNIVIYPAGTGPTDLPRRGFRREPSVGPFPDIPGGARVLAL
jgi:site-specific DNA recombinase